MDLASVQPYVALAVGGVGTVIWWGWRTVLARVTSLKDELAAHKLHVAETYVPNASMQRAMDAINDVVKVVFAKLEKIDDKLDAKADKK